MKHNLKILSIIVGVFFISQIIGLLIVNQYIDHKGLAETGNVTFTQLPYNVERPQVDQGTSFWYIIISVLIGTLILLVIIKFKKFNLWRFWYFLSVLITLTVSFAAFVNQSIAGFLAAIAAFFKIFKPNIWVHNITEVFIYGGLAAIFVPMINVFSALMLLILISIYDMYAVWKSKHMVALAEFTTESKVFAGLTIPYNKSSGKIAKSSATSLKQSKSTTIKNAILGGGDIGFPLLFAGAVMKNIMLTEVFWIAFLKSLIIPIMTSIALYLLFIKGDKNKFYPAMPFLSAGCLLGYGIILLINLI